MKIRKLVLLLIASMFLFVTYVYAETPEITATSGAVIDCIDGKFLCTKNMNEKIYPASLTKILTAIIVVENRNMQDQVVVNQSAIDMVESGYLTSNIMEGETLTVEELLNILLISSCNDAANVLAENIGGTTDGFIEMMNQKAKEIGCTNSNFTNCSGEHSENNYSTAHDLALIGKYAIQYDEIKQIVGKISYTLRNTEVYSGKDRLYETSNEMILSGSENYNRYVKGGKTGFTTPAGYCLMVYTEKEDMPYITVVMKSTTANSRYEDAKKLFNFAYENNTLRKIAAMGSNLQTISIKNATSNTKKLNAVLDEDIIAVVKIENSKTNVEPNITIYDKIKAPIKKGEIIGTVSYQIEGKVYTGNLLAESDVKKSNTGIILILVFSGLITLVGYLRIASIIKRNKFLNSLKK